MPSNRSHHPISISSWYGRRNFWSWKNTNNWPKHWQIPWRIIILQMNLLKHFNQINESHFIIVYLIHINISKTVIRCVTILYSENCTSSSDTGIYFKSSMPVRFSSALKCEKELRQRSTISSIWRFFVNLESPWTWIKILAHMSPSTRSTFFWEWGDMINHNLFVTFRTYLCLTAIINLGFIEHCFHIFCGNQKVFFSTHWHQKIIYSDQSP
jgi:hypothetical protein